MEPIESIRRQGDLETAKSQLLALLADKNEEEIIALCSGAFTQSCSSGNLEVTKWLSNNYEIKLQEDLE